MSEQQKRRRSPEFECRQCTLCIGNRGHCWMETAFEEDDDDDWTPEAIAVAEEGGGILWMCRHCPAWMEMLADDDGEETDFDEAWETATILNATKHHL